MKLKGIYPWELLFRVMIPFAFYIYFLFGCLFTPATWLRSAYPGIIIGLNSGMFVALRAQARQSGWEQMLRASPLTVRQRVRADYLWAAAFAFVPWVLCLGAWLLGWRLHLDALEDSIAGYIKYNFLPEGTQILPFAYPLAMALGALPAIALSALRIGPTSRSRVMETVLALLIGLPFAAAGLLMSMLSIFSGSYAFIFTKTFLWEIRLPAALLAAAGLTAVALSWCVSLRTEYRRSGLRSPRRLLPLALLFAALCLACAVTGGQRLFHTVAIYKAAAEDYQAEHKFDQYTSPYYTPENIDEEAAKKLAKDMTTEVFLGKQRADYLAQLEALGLKQSDTGKNYNNEDETWTINHFYRVGEAAGDVRLKAEFNPETAELEELTVSYQQELTLDRLTFSGLQEIIENLRIGSTETELLTRAAFADLRPKMVRIYHGMIEPGETRMYLFNASIMSLADTVNKSNVSEAAGWLQIEATVVNGIVTDVMPLLNTSYEWTQAYQQEHLSALRKDCKAFEKLGRALAQPLIGTNSESLADVLRKNDFSKSSETKWTDPSRTVTLSAADGTLQAVQYEAPEAIKVADDVTQAQLQALLDCVPAGSDAAALHAALVRAELLPCRIVEHVADDGAVQRTYECKLIAVQNYNFSGQRIITLNFILRDGWLTESHASFLPAIYADEPV